jgi:hypothetical protein
MKNLIKKGFAWAILDENGGLVWDFTSLNEDGVTAYSVYPTKKKR